MRTAATKELVLVFAILTCPSPTSAVAAPAVQRATVRRPGASQTDRSVLSVVLNHEFAGDKGAIVLEDRTITADTERQNTIAFGLKRGWIKPVREGESVMKPGETTVLDSMRRNRKPVQLHAWSAGRKVIMLSEKERDRIFAHGGWTAFYKRFPNSTGLTMVSLPGYSKDGSEAVVMLGNQRQGKWGHGTLYFLTREKRYWRVRGTMGLWVS